jgi:hypothetical protein
MRMSEAYGVLLLVGVWSCGGSGDSGPQAIDTGLPEATQLQDVSVAQATSACENLQSSIESRFAAMLTERRICEMVGAFSATTTADCQEIADACVQQNASAEVMAAEDFDVAEGLSCNDGVANFAGCNVTVGEYEDCLSAQISQVEALFKSFSCANAGTLTMDDFDVGGTLDAPASDPACERLAAECPAAAPF